MFDNTKQQIESGSYNPHEIGGHQTVLKTFYCHHGYKCWDSIIPVPAESGLRVETWCCRSRTRNKLLQSQENRCHSCIVAETSQVKWVCSHLMGKMMINQITSVSQLYPVILLLCWRSISPLYIQFYPTMLLRITSTILMSWRSPCHRPAEHIVLGCSICSRWGHA